MSNARATVVSRQLRDAGFVTTSDFSHEGMRVRRSLNRVHVTAQFDNENSAIMLATEAAEELRALGYEVKQDSQFLCVLRDDG